MPAAANTILCPVDFSDLSAAALRYAVALAKRTDAVLTVLYANSFSAPPYFTGSRLEELKRQYDDSFKEAEDALRRFVGEDLPASAVLRVIEALPADGIRQVAEESGAKLIVMGTHGRSGMNRWMLGSVAERVLRESSVPVLTVRSSGSGSPRIRKILCPVNDTEVARLALKYASEIAHCFEASLTVLHVREPHAARPIENICAWVPAEDRARCDIQEEQRDGEAAAEIVSIASAYDLLVIGSEHRPFFDSTVIGSTTARVVRHAPCPVLTFVGDPGPLCQ